MKGLEICRSFYFDFGRAMLDGFPELKDKIAVGLVGSGSECYGFDDEISHDHDFEAGFQIFIDDSVDSKTEFRLERAYSALPKEYMGLTRSKLNPCGGNRHGVFRISDYLEAKIGTADVPKSWQDYARIPDYALAEAVNGEIFSDGFGKVTAIREALANPPIDWVYKKLCGHLITMSQTAEYNYPRMAKRGDRPAAHLTADEFVKSTVSAAFWADGKAVPYYKWQFASLRSLPYSGSLPDALADILDGNDVEANMAKAIAEVVGIIGARHNLPVGMTDLQSIAMYLNGKISDGELRNLSPLAAV